MQQKVRADVNSCSRLVGHAGERALRLRTDAAQMETNKNSADKQEAIIDAEAQKIPR
jgi:hypothetical protein